MQLVNNVGKTTQSEGHEIGKCCWEADGKRDSDREQLIQPYFDLLEEHLREQGHSEWVIESEIMIERERLVENHPDLDELKEHLELCKDSIRNYTVTTRGKTFVVVVSDSRLYSASYEIEAENEEMAWDLAWDDLRERELDDLEWECEGGDTDIYSVKEKEEANDDR